MKNLLITDSHGRDFSQLISKLKGKVDRVIHLGDFDLPEHFRYLQGIQGVKTIVLSGNHELAFCEHKHITSRNISNSEEYFTFWNESPKEKAEILRLARKENRGFAGTYIEKKARADIAYTHAFLAKNIHEAFWTRLINYNYKFDPVDPCTELFNRMKKKNIDILFRGHDHTRRQYQLQEDRITETIIPPRSIIFQQFPVVLSLGAYITGEYAIFDDEKLEIHFKNEDWTLQ